MLKEIGLVGLHGANRKIAVLEIEVFCFVYC